MNSHFAHIGLLLIGPMKRALHKLMMRDFADVPVTVHAPPSIPRPKRPLLHRAGLRLQLALHRLDYFKSLDSYKGVPATRDFAGIPARLNRRERRDLMRRVAFA